MSKYPYGCSYIHRDDEKYAQSRCGSHAMNQQDGPYCDHHYEQIRAEAAEARVKDLETMMAEFGASYLASAIEDMDEDAPFRVVWSEGQKILKKRSEQ